MLGAACLLWPRVETIRVTDVKSDPAIRRLVSAAIAAGDLGPDLLDRLLVGARVNRLANNEILVERGVLFPFLVVVLEGELELSITAHTGRRHMIARLSKGQTYGFVPVFEGKAVYTSRALAPTAVLLIRREAVLDVLHADAALAVRLLHDMAERARMLFEFISYQATLPPLGRVANTLLTLIGLAPPGTALSSPEAIDLRLTQSDIADMMGVSRQSLNRHLKTLASSGAIALGYGSIEVRDVAALQRCVGP